MMKSTSQQMMAAFLVAAAVLAGCGSDDGGGTPAPTQQPTQPAVATNTPKPTATLALASPTQAGQATSTPTQAEQATSTPAAATATASPTATGTTSTQPTSTPGQGGSGKIVFGAAGDNQFFTDLFVINADGSGRTNITNSSADSETQPSWSHDGTKILYRLNDSTIAVMNADGSGQHPVITTTGPLYYPAWNADDSRIVFVADEDISTQNDNTIAVVNTDGSGLATVVSTKGNYLSPSFNPDGSKIAFGTAIGDGIEIAIVNSDGSDLHMITNDGTVHDGPEWSPDGANIAYGSFDPVSFVGGIYLIHPDGTGAHLLYETTGASNVAWNRNGSKLAYDGIGIVDADGSNGALVPNTSDGFDPDLD